MLRCRPYPGRLPGTTGRYVDCSSPLFPFPMPFLAVFAAGRSGGSCAQFLPAAAVTYMARGGSSLALHRPGRFLACLGRFPSYFHDRRPVRPVVVATWRCGRGAQMGSRCETEAQPNLTASPMPRLVRLCFASSDLPPHTSGQAHAGSSAFVTPIPTSLSYAMLI
jgi:hypothetical protein